jgi:2-amino-4-hydroxy-6-hydroxymethyldihydropteridine diphosphokinase
VARGVTAYLSLGSNVGERRANLQAAVDRLKERITVLRSSSVYDTEPVGEVLDQPEFLNACLEIETDLEPLALLDVCKAVEAQVGRTATVRHGPRVIDVDVLLLGDTTLRHERLNLPHEDLATGTCSRPHTSGRRADCRSVDGARERSGGSRGRAAVGGLASYLAPVCVI